MSWIFTFLRDIKTKERTSEPLTATELDHAHIDVLKGVQNSAFSFPSSALCKRANVTPKLLLEGVQVLVR